jgi:hypothetical protein
MDVAGSEQGALAVGHVGFVETPRDAPLAVSQPLAYLGFHSKSLVA